MIIMGRKIICLNFVLLLIVPALSITVVANQPPEAPIITGPTTGIIGKEYKYTFSAIDPDDHEIYLWIEWEPACSSCEWIGPFQSGEKVTMNYSWSSSGNYMIKATAKDIYDEEGPVGTLKVTMPRSKLTNLYLLGWMIEQFLNLFPMLRFIL